MKRNNFAWGWAAVGLLSVSAACAAGNEDNIGGGGTGASTSDGGNGAGGEVSDGGSGAGDIGGTFDIGGGGSGFEGEPIVYGHSRDTLYKLDPTTKEVSVVGAFSGCEFIVDIALDKDSNIYGTTDDAGIFRIDPEDASCILVADGPYPNSLSFVPAGTLDPNEEALVGFLDDQYVRINLETGAILNIGQPWNGDYISSGDIVSVKGGPTYLTIKNADNGVTRCKDVDCLVEINPATGVIIKDFGEIGYNSVFGTAFWAGKVFGFTQEGDIFEITINGNNATTSPISTDDGLEFWGAGSTTSAPAAPR